MTGAGDAAEAMKWIEALASEVGPRRPTSAAERNAAELVSRRLRDAGVGADLEAFSGYSTFAIPVALIAGLALVRQCSRRIAAFCPSAPAPRP